MLRHVGLSALLVSVLAACGQGDGKGGAAGAKAGAPAMPPAQVGVVTVQLD
jgi:hypothetical protein